MRIRHRDRIFLVRETRTGIPVIYERILRNPGHPFMSGYTNRVIYHAGQGRQPSKLAREVLALADIKTPE